jgi:hypothetical protein
MRKTWRFILVPLLIGMISGCGPEEIPIEPRPWDGCTPVPTIEPTGQTYTIEPGDEFIKDQVIVTGREDDIDRVLEKWESELALIKQVDMNWRECWSRLTPGQIGMRFPVIRVYQITSAADLSVGDVEELIRKINGRAQTLGTSVFADLNYLIGRPLPDVEGDPDCVEGGPAGGGSASAGQGLFWDQWAFDDSGIGLLTGTGQNKERAVDATGQDIRVGVFDASPFESQGGWTIPWVTSAGQALNLCVSHPGPVTELGPSTGLTKFSDHGLFVAGLVHAVAPESRIHLIRVLNDENRGDLGTLVTALGQFITDTLESNGGTLHGTVINLSLGIHQPEDTSPIKSLETQLALAHACGAVVVASAGNDSSEDARIPAAYSFVLGVAGSNIDDELACFSNTGDVAAPGGDNGPGDNNKPESPACESMVEHCADSPEYCVVSLAMRTSPESGYAYWTGTSFAAPLASGLATLVLEDLVAGGIEVPPDEVYGKIEDGATTEYDIIDVQSVLP